MEKKRSKSKDEKIGHLERVDEVHHSFNGPAN